MRKARNFRMLVNYLHKMVVEVSYTNEFKRRAKALEKKYHSFQSDYNAFLDEIEKNPTMGTSLGEGVYKCRMAITSKGKGKSGGARVITYVIVPEEDYTSVRLLTIYDKSEIENVSDTYIKSLLQ